MTICQLYKMPSQENGDRRTSSGEAVSYKAGSREWNRNADQFKRRPRRSDGIPLMALSNATSAIFRHRNFRLVWSAGLLVYLATWLANVAAAWLMTQLSPSPFMVALIQSASALPFLFLSLPAGVLADVLDRRTVMLVAQIGNVVVCLAVAILAATDTLGPWGLIWLTFMLGALLALHGPASQVTVAEVVPREQMPAAVALNGIAYNLARSAGPGLGGVLLSIAGAPILFVITAMAFVAASLALYRLPPSAPAQRALPPERMGAAMQAAFRYAMHAPPLQAVIVRASLFAIWGSALWALLPLVAKAELGGSAAGYGVLIGCLGAGAVLGGLLLGFMRRHLELDRLVMVASLVFAAATLAVSQLRTPALIYPVLIIGGAAWLTCNTLQFTLAQTNVPSWVRARANGLLLVIFQGGMALGAMVWGVVATHLGVSNALLIAALCAVPLQWINRRHVLRSGTDDDVTLAQVWGEGAWTGPTVTHEGQVAIEVRYQVADADHAAFLKEALQLGPARRRNGAVFWRLFREVENDDGFVERFIVDSWVEYQRQLSRSTVSDQDLLAALQRFRKPGTEVSTTHFIAIG